MIKELLIAMIAFLGSLTGIILAKMAKEEVEPGRKYFRWLKRVLLLILTISLLSPIWSSYGWILPFIGGLVLSFFLKKRYLYLGFATVVASVISLNFFLLVAMLVFLYGLPYGTLQNTIKNDFFLFIAPFLLFAFPEILINNAEIWLAFVAGTLFFQE